MIFECEITPPEYSFILQMESPIDFRENDILNYAMVAQGDIIALGGSTNVTGNMYSFGTYPENVKRFQTTDLGGVLAGYDGGNDYLSLNSEYLSDMNASSNLWDQNGQLTVDGTVGTHGALKTEEIDSNIQVTSNVYAEYLSIEQLSYDSSIDIDGDAFLLSGCSRCK